MRALFPFCLSKAIGNRFMCIYEGDVAETTLSQMTYILFSLQQQDYISGKVTGDFNWKKLSRLFLSRRCIPSNVDGFY